jgi:hypothetical protein
MEQITYLLFIKRLDELQTNEERKATMLKQRRISPTIIRCPPFARTWSSRANYR